MTAQAKLLVILGPTASGKSDLALAVARRAGAEILSLDSMQVYRGMEIGTAKPSAGQRAEVRHHLLDLVSTRESFTVARFVRSADAVIADAASRGMPLVATGGTPLYYKALFQGLFTGPSADEAIRTRLRALSGDELHERLATIDKPAAERIHRNDTRRLIRALEVHELTGQPISSMQNEWSSSEQRYHAAWVGLHWDREALNRRINARVKAMLDAGWVQEVRRLLNEGGLSATAVEGTGYHELIDHLSGKLSLEEAGEQIKIATRQLARRQMKWFRRFPNVQWIAGDRPAELLEAETIRLWNGIV